MAGSKFMLYCYLLFTEKRKIKNPTTTVSSWNCASHTIYARSDTCAALTRKTFFFFIKTSMRTIKCYIRSYLIVCTIRIHMNILWNGSICRSREHQSRDLPYGFTAGLFNISYALAHFQSLHTPATLIFIFHVVELRVCFTELSVRSRFLVLICVYSPGGYLRKVVEINNLSQPATRIRI